MDKTKKENVLVLITVGLYEALKQQLDMTFTLGVRIRLLQEAISSSDIVPKYLKDEVISKLNSSYDNSINYLDKMKEIATTLQEFSGVMADLHEDEEELVIEKEETNIKKKKFYFTFGQIQKHTIKGIDFNKDTVVLIEAVDEHSAVKIMHKYFEDKWSFCYSEKTWNEKDMSRYYKTIYKLK